MAVQGCATRKRAALAASTRTWLQDVAAPLALSILCVRASRACVCTCASKRACVHSISQRCPLLICSFVTSSSTASSAAAMSSGAAAPAPAGGLLKLAKDITAGTCGAVRRNAVCSVQRRMGQRAAGTRLHLHQRPLPPTRTPRPSHAGGISVTLVGHPFDTLKVRLQTQPTNPPIYCGWACGGEGAARVAAGCLQARAGRGSAGGWCGLVSAGLRAHARARARIARTCTHAPPAPTRTAAGVVDCARKTIQWEGLGGLYKVRPRGCASYASRRAAHNGSLTTRPRLLRAGRGVTPSGPDGV